MLNRSGNVDFGINIRLDSDFYKTFASGLERDQVIGKYPAIQRDLRTCQPDFFHFDVVGTTSIFTLDRVGLDFIRQTGGDPQTVKVWLMLTKD